MSDKTRVLATFGHQACPWRVHASLYSNDHSFEVMQIHIAYICPVQIKLETSKL